MGVQRIPTVGWSGDHLWLLDQTRLPRAEVRLEIRELGALCEAIRALRVRGAPAIGIAAAYGVALAARRRAAESRSTDEIDARLTADVARLRETRPTAVNLSWAAGRALACYRAARAGGAAPAQAATAVLAEARRIHAEDLRASRAMGRAGAALLAPGARVLTHCNTGGLATGGLGTALAVVFAAQRAGKHPRVWVAETRPLLQGARLTAWELRRAGIPATLLVDGARAYLMARGEVDAVLVGADRIAANGDTANKIGTLAAAVAAARYGVPFYVVAPWSTFDATLADGSRIPVEQRPAEEVCRLGGQRVAPEGMPAWNPAFDITPAALISGWVTETGPVRPPFGPRQEPARVS